MNRLLLTLVIKKFISNDDQLNKVVYNWRSFWSFSNWTFSTNAYFKLYLYFNILKNAAASVEERWWCLINMSCWTPFDLRAGLTQSNVWQWACIDWHHYQILCWACRTWWWCGGSGSWVISTIMEPTHQDTAAS